MDRKKEIQNQIAELQRELAGMDKSVILKLEFDDGFGGSYPIYPKSLSDEDVIAALEKHPDIGEYGDEDMVIYGDNIGYEKKFHVTRNVSYNITPF